MSVSLPSSSLWTIVYTDSSVKKDTFIDPFCVEPAQSTMDLSIHGNAIPTLCSALCLFCSISGNGLTDFVSTDTRF